jgi:Uma2 family endonuclease
MKLTYDDFVLFPDDGKRHELIDGEHYVTASPNTKHQQVSMELAFLIRAWLEDHPWRVYLRAGETFTRPRELSHEAGETLTTPLLPGLALPLSRIFRE